MVAAPAMLHCQWAFHRCACLHAPPPHDHWVAMLHQWAFHHWACLHASLSHDHLVASADVTVEDPRSSRRRPHPIRVARCEVLLPALVLWPSLKASRVGFRNQGAMLSFRRCNLSSSWPHPRPSPQPQPPAPAPSPQPKSADPEARGRGVWVNLQ